MKFHISCLWPRALLLTLQLGGGSFPLRPFPGASQGPGSVPVHTDHRPPGSKNREATKQRDRQTDRQICYSLPCGPSPGSERAAQALLGRRHLLPSRPSCKGCLLCLPLSSRGSTEPCCWFGTWYRGQERGISGWSEDVKPAQKAEIHAA